MVGAENDLMNNLSRQAVQGGSTVQSGSPTVSRFGAIAQLASGSGNTVLVLAPDTTRAQVRFLFVGQVIDVITTTSGAVLAAARTITAIDRSNPAAVTVTVSGANITRVTGDQIVVSGSYDAEFGGLPYLINDAAGDAGQLVHGLSSAAVPNWTSNVVGSPTTPTSEDLLEEMKEVIENDGDGRRDQARIYVMSSPQRRALANKLVALKRYTPAEAVTPKAGFKGLDVADGIAVTDKYALDNAIFLFNPEELEWFVGLDFGVEDRYGSVLQPAADGSDAFTFRIRAYTTLAAPNRNSHSRANVQPVS